MRQATGAGSSTAAATVRRAFAAHKNAERHSRQDPPGAAKGVSSPEGAGAETRTPAADKKL
jgi:hypothetical protein